MGSKNCPNCKVKRSPGHEFCLSCGFNFNSQPDIKKSIKKQKMSVLVQLIIGMIIGFVFVFLIFSTNLLPIIFFPVAIIGYIIIFAILYVFYKCLHG